MILMWNIRDGHPTEGLRVGMQNVYQSCCDIANMPGDCMRGTECQIMAVCSIGAQGCLEEKGRNHNTQNYAHFASQTSNGFQILSRVACRQNSVN